MFSSTTGRFLRSIFPKRWKSVIAAKLRQDVAIKYIDLDVSAVEPTTMIPIEICSHWEQYVSYQLSDESNSYNVDFQYCNFTSIIEDTDIDIHSPDYIKEPLLRVFVPEYVNVAVRGNLVDLVIKNKIYGDLQIDFQNGNVCIDKCKGAAIKLALGNGDLQINKILEGNISIHCGNISGKIMNGNAVSVNCNGKISVDAVYGLSTKVSTDNGLRLGLFKGSLQAHIKSGDAYINGIDGSFEMTNDEGNIDLQVNSLTPRSLSKVMARIGTVNCVLDPQIQAFIDCETEHSNFSDIRINSDNFTQISMTSNKTFGKVMGKSQSTHPIKPGRADRSGKINLQKEHAERAAVLPDNEVAKLLIRADQKIHLKTSSWIEIIQKKHGINT